jgi:hypothetical protein
VSAGKKDRKAAAISVPPDNVSFEVALTQINQSNLRSSGSVSNRGRDAPYDERHLRELACKDRLRWEIGDCRAVDDRMEDVIPGSCAKHWTNELNNSSPSNVEGLYGLQCRCSRRVLCHRQCTDASFSQTGKLLSGGSLSASRMVGVEIEQRL